MTLRGTLSDALRYARGAVSRATIRDFDDNYLWQVIKTADVHKGESPTNFERIQPLGLSTFPLKQDDEQQQQAGAQSGSGGASSGGVPWGEDQQPQGKAAEALIFYVNGDRDHPVALVGDRRIRPHNAERGSTILYHASGTGQKVYVTKKGVHIIATNDEEYSGSKSGGGSSSQQQKADRYVSIRHAKIEKQQAPTGSWPQAGGGQQQSSQSQEPFKHEGKANTEIRHYEKKIEISHGDENDRKVVATYEVEKDQWTFKSDKAEFNHKEFTVNADNNFTVNAKQNYTVNAQTATLHAENATGWKGPLGV